MDSIQLDFRIYRRQFRQPLVTRYGEWRDRCGIILRLSDECGNVGFGEIAPLEWFGTESFEAALDFCQEAKSQGARSQKPEAKGLGARSQEPGARRLGFGSQGVTGLSSRVGTLQHRQAAQVGWGWQSQTVLVPVDSLPACQFGWESAWEMYGISVARSPGVKESRGRAVRSQESGARSQEPRGQAAYSPIRTLPDRSLTSSLSHPSALPHSVLLPTGAGALEAWRSPYTTDIRTFKWKIGTMPVETEWRLFEKLLAQLPGDVKLRLDANGGLNWETACGWLERCDRHTKIEFLEQPLPPDQFEAMQRLSQQYRTAIALDESVATVGDLELCQAKGWRGIFVVKAAIAGSPSRLRQFCQQSGVDVVWSSVFETAIARQYIQTQMIVPALRSQQPQRALGFGVNHWFVDTTFDQLTGEQLWQHL